MHSSCRSDSDTLKLLSPPETFVLELPTRIDKPHQSCSASWPSNVVSNSANIPQSHNESTELASCRRATSANIGNKGTSVFRDPRVSRLEHVSASDQQSPREPHPADPDRLPTTILAPVSSRTISGRGDTDGLGVDLVSPSRDGQASASAGHHRSVAKRLIFSSESIKRIFFSRGARKTHHQITHPPAFPPPPANVLDDRTPKGTGSDNPSWIPGPGQLEDWNQDEDTLGLDPPKRKFRAQLGNSTPSNRPSTTFTYPPPSPNHPGSFVSPSSHPPSRPSSRTATHWDCTPGFSPPDEPETSRFGAPSRSSHPSGTDNDMAPPDDCAPKNPSAKLTRLPHSPDRTAASAKSPSWHQPVAQQQHQLDRGSCRVGENEGLDHEAKRVRRGPNSVEERELSVNLETSREHYIEISSTTPHLEIDIPPRVSDFTPHLITPTSIPVKRANSSHPSCRYEPSATHLHATGGSLGQGTSELLPDPSLSPGRMTLSIGSRHQPHADAVTEVSASCNICNGPPAFSRYKRLRSCQRTPSEKGKISVVSYPDLDSSDEEVMTNESEDDNYSEVFTDADSGSYNGPGSPKSASHDWR